MPTSSPSGAVLSWFEHHRRDLPWRRPEVSPWGILVSEVMLQQTPVARVEPAYAAWMARWPTPGALAAEPPATAIRMWGRLGYPRRALRLHQAATVIESRYAGRVPAQDGDLRALPGVGEYTASAVRAFAFRQRVAVLDTNVRRVLARAETGVAAPPAALTRRERDLAMSLLPADPETAATWSAAVMEIGALVCTARGPRCADCPLAGRCRWRATGKPGELAATTRPQPYEGTDRQCRGRLLAALRAAPEPLPTAQVLAAWPAGDQRERALASLIADGLAVRVGTDRVALPQ